jgi:hypothetical protein
MKAIAARSRPEYEDVADLRTLIRDLSLTEPEEVFGLIEHYFPHRRVPAKTRFFVESVFEEGS